MTLRNGESIPTNSMWRRCAALSASVLAGALVAIASPAVAAAPGEAPFRAASTIKGLRFVPLDALPKAPAIVGRAICDCVANPTSEGGRLVKAQGWPVTGEAPLGRFEAVSFAPHFESGTSGSVGVMQGNVAIFEGPRLVALAYGAKSADDAIGRVEALEGGGVRIWDGDVASGPVADIRAEGNDLLLGPLAPEQSFCHGKAVVPNIYGMPIDKARGLLKAMRWSPAPSKRRANEMEFGRETELAKQGVVEVDGCAPTGFAFCSFNYTGPGGVLVVTTVGDAGFPTVARYGVECRRP